ncbi:hypothetical protein D3C81_1818720 [compost metagenome]
MRAKRSCMSAWVYSTFIDEPVVPPVRLTMAWLSLMVAILSRFSMTSRFSSIGKSFNSSPLQGAYHAELSVAYFRKAASFLCCSAWISLALSLEQFS